MSQKIQKIILSFAITIILQTNLQSDAYSAKLTSSPISIDDNGGVVINKLSRSYSSLKGPGNLGSWDICFLANMQIRANGKSFAAGCNVGVIKQPDNEFNKPIWVLGRMADNVGLDCNAQCMNIGSK